MWSVSSSGLRSGAIVLVEGRSQREVARLTGPTLPPGGNKGPRQPKLLKVVKAHSLTNVPRGRVLRPPENYAPRVTEIPPPRSHMRSILSRRSPLPAEDE